MDGAAEQAKRLTLPPSYSWITEPKRRLLVAVCWEIWLTTKPSAFFLTCRDAAKAVGIPVKPPPAKDDSFVIANRWLTSLCRNEVLRVTEAGDRTKRKATRYVFIGEPIIASQICERPDL